MTDFLCNESSLRPDEDYCRVGALIDRRLFLIVVRGSPQKPLEGALVVFLVSFGGLRVKSLMLEEVVIETSGTIEFVLADVDIDAAEGSS